MLKVYHGKTSHLSLRVHTRVLNSYLKLYGYFCSMRSWVQALQLGGQVAVHYWNLQDRLRSFVSTYIWPQGVSISFVALPAATGLYLHWAPATTRHLLRVSHLLHPSGEERSLSKADQWEDQPAHSPFGAAWVLDGGVRRPEPGRPHLEVW